MISNWIYILVGNDRTGKTTFQKQLIKYLCGEDFRRLDINTVSQITHRDAPRELQTLFTINRSFQEIASRYAGSVSNYFEELREEDIVILSSHSTPPCIDDIRQMIHEGKRRFYNVGAVFFDNAIDNHVSEISSELNWDERFYLYNPSTENPENQINQLSHLANNFGDMLMRRAYSQ